jgi:hypothetical protein
VSRKIFISFGIVFLTNLKNANEINGPKVKSDRLLEGGFEDGEDQFDPYSWLRLPPGSALRAKAGPEGCKAWIKTGHLLRIEGLTRT